MPGMKALEPKEAHHQKNCLCEEKVDGTRMTFDGRDIFSDRDIQRNARFPHIVDALRKLDWQVRGEIALPHGNVLQINKKVNWPNARFYLFDLFEHNGQDLRDINPDEARDRMEKIVKAMDSGVIVLPKRFRDFGAGWDYVKSQRRRGVYAEGVILKPVDGLHQPYKIKYLVEEKLQVLDHEAGSAKGAFICRRKNGVVGKVSATSAGYVAQYKTLKAKGLKVFVEVEYQFLTDEGKPFQPRLRRLGTWRDLKYS
jgi:ATP-dependent DNA ligase